MFYICITKYAAFIDTFFQKKSLQTFIIRATIMVSLNCIKKLQASTLLVIYSLISVIALFEKIENNTMKIIIYIF